MSRIKDRMIKSCMESNSQETINFVLENNKRLELDIDISKIEDLNEELKDLKPTEVLERVCLGDFYSNYKYYCHDENGKIRSADSSRIWSRIRNRLDYIVEIIKGLPMNELPIKVGETIKVADQIDREIKVQKEKMKKGKQKIAVPEPVEGEYYDYDDVRSATIG